MEGRVYNPDVINYNLESEHTLPRLMNLSTVLEQLPMKKTKFSKNIETIKINFIKKITKLMNTEVLFKVTSK